MSMNLIFNVKGGGFIDFPFQTPTNLTYAVLSAKTKEDKLKLIEDAMKEWEWEKSIRMEKINEIKSLMDNKNLTLSII